MERQCLIINFIFLIIIVAFNYSCSREINQNSSSSYNEIKCDTVLVAYWKGSNRNRLMTYDSTCNLVFGDGFNDTLRIKIDDEPYKEFFAKTNRSISIVPDLLKIVNNGKETKIKIESLEKDNCVRFILEPGYRYCYLYRDLEKGRWYIEYSNYQRTYY